MAITLEKHKNNNNSNNITHLYKYGLRFCRVVPIRAGLFITTESGARAIIKIYCYFGQDL